MAPGWHPRLIAFRKEAQVLADFMFRSPYLNVKLVQTLLDISQPAANALVAKMETLGILRETTGQRRNRVFKFGEYLSLFAERDQRE